MDLQRFARAITMAVAVAMLAAVPLSAQTSDADDPQVIANAFGADMQACIDSYRSLDPGTSALCLSRTLVRHHDAVFPYAESVIAALDEETDDPDLRSIEAQASLAAAAALLSDPGLCADLPWPEMRLACGSAIAQIDDDPRRCEALPDPDEQVLCLGYYIDIDPGDVGDCRHLDDISYDSEELGRVTGADLCLASAARPNGTPDLCREVENAEARSYCILGTMMPPPEGWTDISICDEIVGINLDEPARQVDVTSPEGLREMCATMVALSGVSSPQALGMCNEVRTPLMRDACLAGAANAHKDGSYCDHIASEALRKLCLDHQAGVKDEGTLAATNAFMEELLAAFDAAIDAPYQEAEGRFDAAALCSMLGQPADCPLRENSVDFRLGVDGSVDGMGSVVVEIPSPVERCPAWTSSLVITLTGGYAGLLSREMLRGEARADLLLEAMIPPSEGAPCELKVGENAFDGTWEATLHDGVIDGGVGFQGEHGEALVPFLTKLKAE